MWFLRRRYCKRLPADAPDQRIVTLYGPHDDHADDYRIDGFLHGLEKTCGDVEHHVTHNVTMHWDDHNTTVATVSAPFPSARSLSCNRGPRGHNTHDVDHFVLHTTNYITG